MTRDDDTGRTWSRIGSVALELLAALRAAGCEIWIDADGDLMVSPPWQAVQWPDDPEAAIEHWRPQLKALVAHECGGSDRVH